MKICGKCGTKNADTVLKCYGCNHVFAGKIIIPITSLIKSPKDENINGLIQITSSIISNIYFKLRNISTNTDDYVGFIRKNESLKFDIISAEFEFRYAIGGDKWLGETELFGSNTDKYICDSKIIIPINKTLLTGYLMNFQSGRLEITKYKIPK